jgi:hypothetical protein
MNPFLLPEMVGISSGSVGDLDSDCDGGLVGDTHTMIALQFKDCGKNYAHRIFTFDPQSVLLTRFRDG